jgi:hypothetical protein
MLSTLPKLADRAFIIGFLLPALVFSALGLWLFGDPDQVRDLLKIAKEDTAQLLLMLGGVWLLSVLLLIVNQALYRCLEGYIPPLSWRKRSRLRAARRIAALRGKAARLRARLRTRPTPRDRREYREIMELVADLPPTPGEAMPTRFGNAIRAFEMYPREAYGADGVGLWFHVATLVPKELLASVNDARAVVDCLVNATFLAALIGLSTLGHIVREVDWGALSTAVAARDVAQLLALAPRFDLAVLLASLVLTYLSYRLAVILVPAWGQAVKACFDVGLPALAEKLGYKLADTEARRRAFWVQVSQTVRFRSFPDRTPILRPENWLPRPPSRPGLLRRLKDLVWGASGN